LAGFDSSLVSIFFGEGPSFEASAEPIFLFLPSKINFLPMVFCFLFFVKDIVARSAFLFSSKDLFADAGTSIFSC
jgi:hypothetical protein